VIKVHITHLAKPVTLDVVLVSTTSTSPKQRCGRALHFMALKFKLLRSVVGPFA
jgi:hypothetical protein